MAAQPAPRGWRASRSSIGAAAGAVAILWAVALLLVLSGAPASHEKRVHTRQRVQTRHPVAAPQRLFSDQSVWNSPLPADAAIDPASAQMIGILNADLGSEERADVAPWFAAAVGSTPIYVVGQNQATQTVHLDDPALWWRRSLQSAFDAVPIPADAVAAPGDDAEMTVWQPSTNRLWEFYHMRREADGWHAAWGGAMNDVGSSPGYYTRRSWPGALPQWGATATSLPVAAGVVTFADLRAGLIDHALALNLPQPRAGVVALPAERGDGVGGSDQIPEGAHLRLDPDLDIDSLHLPALVQMLALAAQKYGLIVRDRTPGGVTLFGQQPIGAGQAAVYRKLFGGRTAEELLSEFPWDDLEVLKLSLRSVAPSSDFLDGSSTR